VDADRQGSYVVAVTPVNSSGGGAAELRLMIRIGGP